MSIFVRIDKGEECSGMGSTLKGQLLVWEGATTDFRKYRIRKDPDCPACGNGKQEK